MGRFRYGHAEILRSFKSKPEPTKYLTHNKQEQAVEQR